MTTTEGHTRITVDLGDPELYKAVRIAAIEQNRPVKAIIAEALREWLAKVEEEEDRQDSQTAEQARQDAQPTMNLNDYGKARGWSA